MDEESLILREEANGHSIYGASKSPRLLVCPGSLRAEFGLPDTAKYEAAEGTVAHDLGDKWMKTGIEPLDRIGETVTMKLYTGTYDIPVTRTMLNYVGEHVSRCLALPGTHLFEHRVDYSVLTPIPDQGGTLDFAAMRPRELDIADLKYGVADQIFAYRNSQPMLYAYGVILKWDWLYNFDKVTIRIHQPRLDHFDVWETSVEEIEAFAVDCKIKFEQAWREDAPRIPSNKACQYCKARDICPERAALFDKLIDDTFEDESLDQTPAIWKAPAASTLTLPTPRGLTTEALVRALTYRKTFEKLFEEYYEELKFRILNLGEAVPELMVAEGKNAREVNDVSGLKAVFGLLGIGESKVYNRKLKSPAQLEELLVTEKIPLSQARKIIKPYTRTIPGPPVVAPVEKGKRPALNLADETFEDESL